MTDLAPQTAAKPAWTAPVLTQLDVSMAQVESSLGAAGDGGPVGTSAS